MLGRIILAILERFSRLSRSMRPLTMHMDFDLRLSASMFIAVVLGLFLLGMICYLGSGGRLEWLYHFLHPSLKASALVSSVESSPVSASVWTLGPLGKMVTILGIRMQPPHS